jgi:hypothetical protein
VPSPPMPPQGGPSVPGGPRGRGPTSPGGVGPMGPGGGFPPGEAPNGIEELPSGAGDPRRPPANEGVPQGTEAALSAGQASVGRAQPARADGATARRVSTGPGGASPSPRPNRINRPQPQSPAPSTDTNSVGEPPAFFGPTGYDVSN